MRVETNLPHVLRGLARLGALGDMAAAGAGGGTLAQDAQKAVGSGLRARYVDRQQQPDGGPLAALSPRYLRRKVRQGYSPKVLVRTGLMLSEEQLEGELAVGGKSVTMTYGREEQARLEMEWATKGFGKQHRPPRPGYELDEQTEETLGAALGRGLDAQARLLGCTTGA